MRKFAAAALCAALILMLTVPALAAGQLQFTVTPSVAQAAPGDTVSFEVSVKGAAHTSVGYIPVCDENVWKFVEGECLAEDSWLDDFSKGLGGVVSYEEAAVRDGAIFRFTMKVKSDAPGGKTTLTAIVAAKDGGTALETALADTVITVQSQTAAETTSPLEETAATQATSSSEATDPTQATSSSGAADPTQAVNTEATVENVTVGATDTDKDSTVTVGQGTLPDLGSDDSCVADDWDEDVEVKEPVPKKNDTLLLWGIVIAVVAAAAAAAWFFLRKKKTE